jgi:hypothetical protein
MIFNIECQVANLNIHTFAWGCKNVCGFQVGWKLAYDVFVVEVKVRGEIVPFFRIWDGQCGH